MPVLAFVGIVVSVMQTLLVPVIKDLPQLLGTEPGNATWAITSTLLSGAVATPIMGRLDDLHGKRRMLILSLAVMVVGALVSALTSDRLAEVSRRRRRSPSRSPSARCASVEQRLHLLTAGLLVLLEPADELHVRRASLRYVSGNRVPEARRDPEHTASAGHYESAYRWDDRCAGGEGVAIVLGRSFAGGHGAPDL